MPSKPFDDFDFSKILKSDSDLPSTKDDFAADDFDAEAFKKRLEQEFTQHDDEDSEVSDYKFADLEDDDAEDDEDLDDPVEDLGAVTQQVPAETPASLSPKPASKTLPQADKSSTMLGTDREMVDYLVNNLDLLLSCEIGQVKISINELLNFKVGQPINFSSDLQQVKIKVNSATIGYGQIVKVNGKYGIKITKVLSITESLQAE